MQTDNLPTHDVRPDARALRLSSTRVYGRVTAPNTQHPIDRGDIVTSADVEREIELAFSQREAAARKGIRFQNGDTIDVAVRTRDEAPKHDPATVKTIMAVIKQLGDRLTPLEQGTFRANTQEPPRTMGLPEAISASRRAQEYRLAKQHQEFARRILPEGQVPVHSEVAAEEAKEQSDAHRDLPKHPEGAAPTHDKRARLSHVTFSDGKQPDRDLLKQINGERKCQ